MLKAKIIDHLNLDIRHFEETMDFYKKIFGFQLFQQYSDPNCKIIGNKTVKMCLYEVQNFDIGWGLNHFGFHVENFEQILEVCKQNGIPILNGGLIEWAKSSSFYIEDPNGYIIELSKIKGGGLK